MRNHDANSRRQAVSRRFCLLAAAVLVASAGCRSRNPTGSAAGQPSAVDPSWISAAKSCWPALANTPDDKLRLFLDQPVHIRTTFPGYAAVSDDQANRMVTQALTSVMAPDTTQLANSPAPVLTRTQAAEGAGPNAAVAASTHGSAPPDALCSIANGLPPGFSN